MAVVGAGDVGKALAGVACDSHAVLSAAADIDYSRVEGRPGALRTTVTQNLICARRQPRTYRALTWLFLALCSTS